MNDNFFPQACARVSPFVCLSVRLSQAGITTPRPSEVQMVEGPMMHVTIHMNDNFFPQACTRVSPSVCLSVRLSQAGITAPRVPRPSEVQKVEGSTKHVTIHMNDNFFPAGMRSCLSVRLSVCPSVTSWYYDSKTFGGTLGRGFHEARNHTHERQLFSTGMYSCLSVRPSVCLSVCLSVTSWYHSSQDLRRYRRFTSAYT